MGNGNFVKKTDSWLHRWMERRIAQNRSILALFVGPTGSGKSYAAIATALHFSDRFTVDNVVFDVQDFVKLIRHGNLQHGDVVIFDDAGLNINSRTWQSLQNNIFSMVTQSFRYQQIITLITTPDWSYIDWQVRNLFDIFFEATDVQGLMKPFLHIPSPMMGDRRPWRKYPEVQVDGKTAKLGVIEFQLAPQSFLDQYEAKKKKHLEEYYKRFEHQLELSEKLEQLKEEVLIGKIEVENRKRQLEHDRELRNQEILKMLLKGIPRKEIAQKFRISEKTVQRVIDNS